MKKTLKCYECHEEFLREEMVQYASPRAEIMHWYCKKCLIEKQSRDNFSEKICSIFGIKAPGARIWTERKRLIETYGYTDNIIIDCLDYIYNIKKYKKLTDSICLVKPPMVEEMLKYKRVESYKAEQIIKAIKTETKEYIVPIENNKLVKTKIEYNPDDWLED